MNTCPISYIPCEDGLYSKSGLKKLSPGLSRLKKLDFTAEELREEAFYRSGRMSIQGVQPKFSAVLKVKEGKFEPVDCHGRYILKPQHQYYPNLPENEDLTMRLAADIGLELPLHGLIWAKDGSLCYFIRRFDRSGQKDKIPMEDFAQLAGLSRDTKYNYSMEKVLKLIDEYCTFPSLDKLKIFKLVLFSFVTGNEDMHLKNFSILNRNGIIALSPCYDLLNLSIVLKEPVEEMALSLNGKKSGFKRRDLVEYFGADRCGLNEKTIAAAVNSLSGARSGWIATIQKSFLPDQLKEKYILLLVSRLKRLSI